MSSLNVKSKNLRENARQSLSGNWKNAVLITLVYGLIMLAITFILNLIPFVGDIVAIIISIPISFGILVSFIKLKRNEKTSCIDFLPNGFSQFKKVWCIYGHVFLKLLLPILLIIIFTLAFLFIGIYVSNLIYTDLDTLSNTSVFTFFAILCLIGLLASSIWASVKGLYYSLVYYILYDNPNMTAKEIVDKSKELMTGNRWNLFKLNLSFIGWAILSLFTFNIGLLWLIPYIVTSTTAFYENLNTNN